MRRLNGLEAPGRTVEDVVYELALFVSGASDLSARAIANAARICEAHLSGRYHLSVVDVHEDPAALLGSRVVARPPWSRTCRCR